MLLRPGGLDIYYVDESHDGNHYVVTAVRIPFLRRSDGIWNIVWPNQAAEAYRAILRKMDFLPDESIMSVAASKGHFLYGHARLQAAMYALFQRMRRKCVADKTNAITFFDQGHLEYRKLYRMAQVYLPTGSVQGAWMSGKPTENLPMDMFTKDANEKSSKHCLFTQAADLIAYAAFFKIKTEHKQLTDWQKQNGFDQLYESLPKTKVNTKVSNAAPRDGIARLK